MKVGTSYSRCLLDIFKGKVDISDVMVIVARTHFNPTIDTQWDNIWIVYTEPGGEWYGYQDHEKEFRELTLRLYNSGKLHQPRTFGAYPGRVREIWYELILTNEVKDVNPAVKKAWDHYKLLANLT